MKKVQSLFNSKSYDMFFVIGEHWGPLSLVMECVGSPPQPIGSRQVSESWLWREPPPYEDFRDGRPKELIGTPIKGLYMADYQAFSALFMGGIPTAIESGKRAIKAVLVGVPPTERI